MPKRNKVHRRHTNNHGKQSIKSGKVKRDLRKIAYIMRVPYGRYYKERKEE